MSFQISYISAHFASLCYSELPSCYPHLHVAHYIQSSSIVRVQSSRVRADFKLLLLLLLLLLLRRVTRAEQPAEPTLSVCSFARLAGFLLVLHQAERSHALACHGAGGVTALQAAAGRRGRVDVAACAGRCAGGAGHDACGVNFAVFGDVLLTRSGARGGGAVGLAGDGDAEEAVPWAYEAG